MTVERLFCYHQVLLWSFSMVWMFFDQTTGCASKLLEMRYRKNLLKLQTVTSKNRELKIETFSGRRRPDWQSKPGTEVTVASLQNSNIKIAVNSGGRRLGRLPKRKIWLHIKN